MSKIKTYEVLLDIPLVGMSSLKKGQLIDSTSDVFSFLDKSSPLFKEIVQSKFLKGDIVVPVGRRYGEMFVVLSVKSVGTSYDYKIAGVNTKDELIFKEKELTLPTVFYFVNSSGKIINDFEERRGLDLYGLEFKKMCGNYYKKVEDARAWIDEMRKNSVLKASVGYLTNKK